MKPLVQHLKYNEIHWSGMFRTARNTDETAYCILGWTNLNYRNDNTSIKINAVSAIDEALEIKICFEI